MSDNTTRVIQDLKKTIESLPSLAIYTVFCKWKERIDYIDNSIKYAKASEALIQERKVLLKCLKEIQAAYYVDNGNSLKGFQILISEEND